MPCFHGLAVSIHTPDGPLPEYAIQRISRQHRITSYIPVPPPKLSGDSDKPEQSTFAISITLLTPGLNVPYSTPKPTSEDPFPRPKIVGGPPDYAGYRGKTHGVIGPYVPQTSSPNETIAAYIYFDGRAKEEVATLLRRGEETWVNSRWVSVPDSEGGGLAEREFVFREVGLERWLNGLDLQQHESQDVAKIIERRRKKYEKKRAKKEQKDKDSDDDETDGIKKPSCHSNGVLRYGADRNAPVESLSDDDSFISSDSDSDDDQEPMPESAGQIKVALFRVVASGEVKRGEYSPQFDVHDDEEGQNGEDGNADVDHTTGFAKPKSLDPKSISTQTVTGIDPPDKPYAVFTFLYRGERQLRKMGILQAAQQEKTPVSTKRKSGQLDFSKLNPLSTDKGTKGFAGYRDPASSSLKNILRKKGKDDVAMDSDADDDDEEENRNVADVDDAEGKEGNGKLLSPEDALKAETLTEGVRKIRLKRQHSEEPQEAQSPAPQNRKASPSATTPTSTDSPAPANGEGTSMSAAPASAVPANISNSENFVGSPLKKQRASVSGIEETAARKLSGENSGPRRESESAVSALSSALGGGNVWPGGHTEPRETTTSKIEFGPEIKQDNTAMEDEELCKHPYKREMPIPRVERINNTLYSNQGYELIKFVQEFGFELGSWTLHSKVPVPGVYPYDLSTVSDLDSYDLSNQPNYPDHGY